MKRIGGWAFLGLISVLTTWPVSAAPLKAAPSPAVKSPATTQYTSFREAYDAGNRMLRARQFAQAVDAYSQAETLASPSNVKSQASNACGWTLVRARKWIQARDVLRRSVQYDPKNKVALGNLGYAALKIYQYGLGGDPDLQEALKSLEDCSAIDPAYKADLLESAKTIQSRQEADGTVTPVPAPRAGLSYKEAVAFGDKAQAQGQYDLAVQYFKRAEAAATTPKAKGAAANRQGLDLLEARRPKESVVHFEQAVKADPKEKIFLNNLGLAYWTVYDAGLGETPVLKLAVESFFKANSMDASFHGDNLRMALNELKEADPESAKLYDSKKDPDTGEAAPMGSPTAK